MIKENLNSNRNEVKLLLLLSKLRHRIDVTAHTESVLHHLIIETIRSCLFVYQEI